MVKPWGMFGKRVAGAGGCGPSGRPLARAQDHYSLKTRTLRASAELPLFGFIKSKAPDGAFIG